MLGALSVPLTWGVAVPPDDYNHWSQESDDPDAVEAPVPGLITTEPEEGIDEWDEQAEWTAWEEEAEPRFDIPRTNKVVPHSPAAG